MTVTYIFLPKRNYNLIADGRAGHIHLLFQLEDDKFILWMKINKLYGDQFVSELIST